MQRKRIPLIGQENKAVVFIGAGALLFTLWVSGMVLNLSTQYAFNFEFWEAGFSSLGVCTAVTLFPALVLLYLGLKTRREARKNRGRANG
ncbi:MAG: hypothetical protein QW531_01895 [Thermoplasmata archaeon]